MQCIYPTSLDQDYWLCFLHSVPSLLSYKLQHEIKRAKRRQPSKFFALQSVLKAVPQLDATDKTASF